MKKIISVFAFFSIALIQTNCNKDDDASNPNGPDKTGSEWKGIGKSLETPEGTPFHLPAGIKLAGNAIKGYDRNECVCQKKEEDCYRGTGELVRVCLGFTNTTNETITVTIPKGLIVISTDVEKQNGLVIEVETFEIPAAQTVYYSLGTYCLNSGRSSVITGNDVFKLGPVTQNAAVNELMELLKNKRIDNIEAAGIVQAALWNITNGNGLTELDRQFIAALPNN
ncbi:MAG: hypothetical protein KF746_01915 [Chitinophagaceae bacterium]|nr:hypothetical protein [Chitinophagaceae bacterium]